MNEDSEIGQQEYSEEQHSPQDKVEHSEFWKEEGEDIALNSDKMMNAVKDLLTIKAKVSKEFAAVINKNSLENGSNTPDIVLGEYLVDCLWALNVAVSSYNNREGRNCEHSETCKFRTAFSGIHNNTELRKDKVELNEPTFERIRTIMLHSSGVLRHPDKDEMVLNVLQAIRKEFGYDEPIDKEEGND
jgi:hypothetical protein